MLGSYREALGGNHLSALNLRFKGYTGSGISGSILILMTYSSSEQPLTSRAEIRRHIRSLRRQLTPEQQHAFAQAAATRLLDIIHAKQAAKVALYLANDGELDPQPLIERLWQQGIHTYLPKLHPFSAGNLVFIHYHANSKMERNQYGIAEPKLDIRALLPAEQLDIIVTPLVAFDANGNRMGMGGGYYDRTLSQWKQCSKPLPIGFAHDCQQLAHLPCEHWDVPLPLIVTPSQVFASDIINREP